MKVEFKERSPESKAAYWQGYQAAYNLCKEQMLDKMEHYRDILRESSKVLRGDSNAIGFYELRMKIEKEISLNPEYEALEHSPFYTVWMHHPDAFKTINVGPAPK